MPAKVGGHGSIADGLTVAPPQSPFPGLLAGIFPTKGGGDSDVRYALNHCAQCGSGRFHEFRGKDGAGKA
jgi:hypothetical protein